MQCLCSLTLQFELYSDVSENITFFSSILLTTVAGISETDDNTVTLTVCLNTNWNKMHEH